MIDNVLEVMYKLESHLRAMKSIFFACSWDASKKSDSVSEDTEEQSDKRRINVSSVS